MSFLLQSGQSRFLFLYIFIQFLNCFINLSLFLKIAFLATVTGNITFIQSQFFLPVALLKLLQTG